MSYSIEAGRLEGKIVAVRRELHQIPEIGLSLPKTVRIVARELEALGLEPRLHNSSDSITAVIRGKKPSASSRRNAVLLRADMDGLPVAEATGLPFASTTGTMHACGHDLHTAMLLGAAELLSDTRDSLSGDVILMFQAGEEGFDGARHMIEEGVLEAAGNPVVGAFALHVFSSRFPMGRVAVRGGPIMSASDLLTVTVNGKGGHGSAPHLAIDPIVIAAEMIVALQTMVTRRFDIFDPVVLTVTQISGGHAPSVIPDDAMFQVTVRTYSVESRDKMEAVCDRLLRGIATAHGADVTVDYRKMYPVTVNDPNEAARALRVARDLFGADHVEELVSPLTASEDFSRVLAEVPGAFILLGATPQGVDPDSAPFLHSPEAVFDEACLTKGAALLAELARDRLDEGTRRDS